MAVQSNQAIDNSNSLSVFTCTLGSPTTAGACIVVGIGAGSFVAQLTTPTVTDNVGNVYTVQRSFAGGTGGQSSYWLATAVGCIAGATLFMVTLSGVSTDDPFAIFVAEGPPNNAVRVSNVASATFGGTAMSVALAGTVSGDYCAAFAGVGGTTPPAPTVGNFGTNAATSLQTAASGNIGFLLEDGTSSGGTINATATAVSGSTTWAILAAVFFSVPTITVQPANASDPVNATASFSVTATASSGGGALSYHWKLNGTNITGATSSTYTTPALTIDNDRGQYAVAVTDSNGTVTSSTATLSVTWPFNSAPAFSPMANEAFADLPPTSGSNYTASVSESGGAPSDTAVRTFVGARPIAESAGAPADAIARSFVGARGIPESIAAPSDAVTYVKSLTRAIAESSGAPSDSLARAGVFARAVVEAAGAPSDAAARSQVVTRGISESVVAPSDAVSGQVARARAIPESVGAPVDVVQRVGAFVRAIAESAGAATDAIARALVRSRALAESVGAPADAVARRGIFARGLSESIPPPTDNVANGGAPSRFLTEAIGAPTDAVQRAFAGSRAITEGASATPSDSVSRRIALARAITEMAAAPSDAVARIAALARVITESIPSPTDAVEGNVGDNARAIAENIPGPTDAAARVVAYGRALVEGVDAPSDAVGRAQAAARALVEAIVSPSDAVSRGGFTRAIAERVAAPFDLVVAFVVRNITFPFRQPVTRDPVAPRTTTRVIAIASVTSGASATPELITLPTIAPTTSSRPSAAPVVTTIPQAGRPPRTSR